MGEQAQARRGERVSGAGILKLGSEALTKHWCLQETKRSVRLACSGREGKG